MPGTKVAWALDGSIGRLRALVAATAFGSALLIVLLSAPRAETVRGVPAGGGAPAVPPATIGGGAAAAPPAEVGRLGTRRLIAPGPGAVIKRGHLPVFRWVVVKRATYYNVQLFRAGRKILTAWPSRPRYQLQKRWKFAAKTRRLGPGRYRWIVWPGFGPRSRANYGDPIGHSTFVVKR